MANVGRATVPAICRVDSNNLSVGTVADPTVLLHRTLGLKRTYFDIRISDFSSKEASDGYL